MLLFILTAALLAVSEAANLDKRYIHQLHEKNARGSFGGLFSPFGSSIPSGGYANDDLGVVVDAVAPGTRTSGAEPTGLGGPRTSYGSLDSKVGDAAFRVRGTGVKGAALGVASIFGSGTGQKASIGLPGIGIATGSSSLGGSGKKTTTVEVPSLSTGGDEAFGAGNVAVKQGAEGVGSIFGSGKNQAANVGLPGIGNIKGSSSLVGSGNAGAKVTGYGVSKTSYESITPNSEDVVFGGDVAFGGGSVAVKEGAEGVGSIFGSGKNQAANVGLPGIGNIKGSSSLVGSGSTGAKVTGYGVSKTSYEPITPNSEDVVFGVGNDAVKGTATGIGSIFDIGTSQNANIGKPSIGAVPVFSSLEESGIKTPAVKPAGLGISQTFKTVESKEGDAATGVGSSVAKEGAAKVGSIISSGLGQEANIGLPNINVVQGSSSLDGSIKKTTGTDLTGSDVLKTSYVSMDSITADGVGVETAGVKKFGSAVVDSGNQIQEKKIELPSTSVSGTKSPGTLIGFEDDKIYAQKFANNVALSDPKVSVNGGSTGVTSLLDSVASQKVNTGLSGKGVTETSYYMKIDSKDGVAAFGLESAGIEPSSVGVASIFGTEVDKKADIGLPTSGVVSSVKSSDVVLGYDNDKLHSQKLANTGLPNTGILLGSKSSEVVDGSANDKFYAQKFANNAAFGTNGGVIGVPSTVGSGISQGAKVGLPNAGVVSGIKSSEVVEEYVDDKINAQKFANSLNLNAKGGDSGFTSVFGSGTGQKVNIGLPSIGVVPASGAVEGSVLKTSGEKLSSFGISKTSYGSIGSKIEDAAITIGDAAIKTSADGVASIFGSGAGQGANVGLHNAGVIPGVSSSLAVSGHENDEINAQKFANQFATQKYSNGFKMESLTSIDQKVVTGDDIIKSQESHLTTPLPTSHAILTTVEQNTKEKIAGHFDVGTYNVPKYNDKSDYSSSGNKENTKLTISSGDKADKINLAENQGFGTLTSGNLAIQSSIGNDQSFSSVEPTLENNSNGFGLNVKTQNKQESLYDAGKVGVTGSFQTTSSHGVHQEFDKTQHFGVHTGKHGESNNVVDGSSFSAATSSTGIPNLGLQLAGSLNSNSAYNVPITTGSINTNIFDTGNLNLVGAKAQDSKFGSYLSPNPSYTGYKVTGDRSKQPNHQGVQVFTNSSPSKVTSFENSGNHFATKAPLTLNSNTQTILTQYSQQQSSSSHNSDIPQASIPNFPSSHPTISSNFYQSSPNQGSLQTNGNQNTFSHKYNTYSGQKPIIQGEINSQSEHSSTFGSQFSHKPVTTAPFSQTFTAFSQKPTAISQGISGSEKTQFGSSSNSFHNDKSQSIQSSSLSYNGASKGQSLQTTQLGVKPFGSSQNTGSSSSQTQFGSTFGSHSDQNSHKGIGNTYTGTTTTTHVQPSFQFGIKPSSLDTTHSSSPQSQYSSTSGSKFGQKIESTGTFSQTSSVGGQKLTETIPTSSGKEQTQFGSSSSSLHNDKSHFTQSTSLSYNGASKDQSVQTTQFGVKPVISTQNKGSDLSQTHFGSTYGTQSSLNSQKGVGTFSTTTSQVQPTSQVGIKPFSSHSSQTSSHQSEHSSTFSSQFSHKPETTGTFSQTFTAFGQKPTGISQGVSGSEKTQFGSSSSSFHNDNSQSIQSSSLSYNGASKGQSSQTTQLGVKPFSSSQNTGSSSLQTQFGSTFGSHSDLNSHKGIGNTYTGTTTTTTHVQPSFQFGIKPSGLDTTHSSSPQSQYSSTSGSKFGQQPESTGTFSQTSSVGGQKPTETIPTSSGKEQTQFGSSSSSLHNDKSHFTQSSSLSYNEASKDQSVHTTQFGVKPVGSTQNTGSGLSQTHFGSTYGTQSSLNSQKGVGTFSTTTSQVQPTSQVGIKPFSSHSSQTSSHQSEHSSTFGSQFSHKPETTGTFSQTFTAFGQNPTGISQGVSGSEKTQFGSSSSSFHNDNSQSIQSSSLSYNGASKGQSSQTTQLGVKPFSSSQNTGSSSLQTQFGSKFGSHSDQTSHKGIGNTYTGTTTTTTHVQPSFQFGIKPSGLDTTHISSPQSQYSSTSGSKFGQQPESTGTFSQTSSVGGQKPTETIPTSSGKEQTQFGSSSSSLHNDKSHFTQSSSLSYNGASKDQSVHTTQFGVKPVGSTQNTGSGLSQTHFGSTYGTQSSLNSQKGVGTFSTTTSQVQPTSQVGIKPFSSHSSQTSSHQSEHSSTFGSQFSHKPETTGTFSQTFTTFGQNPTGISQSVSGSEKTQFGSSSSSFHNDNSQSIQSSSLSYNGASKGQSSQTTQLGVKPFSSSQNTGSSSLQTQFGSKFGSHSDQNSHKSIGNTYTGTTTTTTHVQPSFQFGIKPSGLDTTHSSSPQSQYSSTSGSKFGQQPESTGTFSQTSSVSGQKPTETIPTSSGKEQTQFGSSSSSLHNDKSHFTQSSSLSYNGASKDQSVHTTQFGVKPVGSTQNTGSGLSQTHFGSTYGTQSSLNSQKGVGTFSTTTSQVQPTSQVGIKPFSSHSSQTSSHQSEHSSTFGSQFSHKPETTGTFSQTFTAFGQKPTGISQGVSGSEKTQFGSSSNSFHNDKSQSIQSSSLSYNGASKGQSLQTTQLGVKPFGFSQNTGSSSSQTQFGSTFGSHSDQNSHKGIGNTYTGTTTTTTHVQPSFQFGIKPSGLDTTHSSSPQSQYSSTSGSKFGQKIESTGTFPQTSSVGGQKLTETIPTSSGKEQTQFGSSSGSLHNDKSHFTQSSSMSYNGASKDQSVLTTQFGVKPVGSTQNTGSGLSQTHFGSTYGTQSSLNSQKGVGTLSTATSQVEPSQVGIKPSSSHSSQTSYHQSDHSSTPGSQLSHKPDTVGPFSQTFTAFGQKPTGMSQGVSGSEKTQFGSSSSSLHNDKSQSSQSSSLSYSGTSKGQSALTSQIGSKPFGSPLSTSVSGNYQTQFGSTFGTHSSLNAQKGVGATTTITSQDHPTSLVAIKPSGSQSNQISFQQSQYSSTIGTQLSQKPSAMGTISQQFTGFGHKPAGASQPISGNEKIHFGSSLSSLHNDKSQSTQSNSFSLSSATKDQPGQTHSTGSNFPHTHFSSAYGSQKKPLDLQSNQLSLPGQTHSVLVDHKPFNNIQTTGFGVQHPNVFFSLGDPYNNKPQSIFNTHTLSTTSSQSKNTFGSTQTPFQNLFGLTTGQHHGSSASASANSGSLSGTQTSRVSKYQTTQFATNIHQPFGGSLWQTGQRTPLTV